MNLNSERALSRRGGECKRFSAVQFYWSTVWGRLREDCVARCPPRERERERKRLRLRHWKPDSAELRPESWSHCQDIYHAALLARVTTTQSKQTPDHRDHFCCVAGSGEKSLQPLLTTTTKGWAIRNYLIAIVMPAGLLAALKCTNSYWAPTFSWLKSENYRLPPNSCYPETFYHFCLVKEVPLRRCCTLPQPIP